MSVTSWPMLKPPDTTPPRGNRALALRSYPVYTSLTSPKLLAFCTWKNGTLAKNEGLRSWKPQIWLPPPLGRRESGGAVTQNDWYADGGRVVLKAAMKFPKVWRVN